MKKHTRKKTNPKKAILVLFVIAFALRLIPAIWFSDLPKDDAAAYNNIAISLAHGEGFRLQGELTATREPLLPYVASLIYRLLGEDARYVYAFQALLSAIVPVLIFYISRAVFQNERPGWLAAIITALYPNFILYTKVIVTETLFTFLLTLTIFFLIQAIQQPGLKYYGLTGLTLGLTILTKASFLLFPTFILISLFLLFKKRIYKEKTMQKGIAIMLLVCLLVIGSWALRNYLIWDEFIPIVSRGGTALFYGTYIPYNNMYTYDRPLDSVELAIMGDEKDPIKIDQRFYQAAKDYLIAHPIASFFFYLKKMLILWYGPADAIGYPLQVFTGNTHIIYEKPIISVIFETDLRVTIMTLSYVGLFWLCIALALYGLWYQRKNKLTWLLIMPIVYATLIYSIVQVSPRYKEPVLVFIFIMASQGWQHYKARKHANAFYKPQKARH